jgi:hypothetical protein
MVFLWSASTLGLLTRTPQNPTNGLSAQIDPFTLSKHLGEVCVVEQAVLLLVQLQDLFGQAGINGVGNGPATVAVDQAGCPILLIALLQASDLSVADLQQNGSLFQIDATIKHMLQYPDSV